MIRFLQIVIVSCFAIILGCANSYATATASPESQYRAARTAYVHLTKDTAKQQYRHNWDKVLRQLQHFAENYPDHPKAPSACYLLAKSYSKLYTISRVSSDAQHAIDSFSALARRYHDSSLADDALYLQAEIQLKTMGRSEDARDLCEQIFQQYPRGDMVNKARKLYSALPDKIAPQKAETVKFRPVSCAPNNKTTITAVRSQADNIRTRVVIELSHKAEFKVNTLAASQKDHSLPRLYFDISGAEIGKKTPATHNVNRGVIQKIRLGQNSHYARVVCDLKKLTPYNVFSLQNPPRIVVDIAHEPGAVLGEDVPQIQSLPPSKLANDAGQRQIAALLNKVPEEQPVRVNLPDVATKKNGRLRIVVDAGHGGKDPGAIGPGKLYEKDITLKIAKLLSARLEKQLNCEVLLTRKNDVYIPLHQRTAYANKVDADLFISIHANASTNKKAHGIETFYLNFSNNDKAVAVAARENGMSLKEIGDLELILCDLMANAKINESSRLATDIQSSLTSTLKRKYPNVKDLGVRQGPFHVLLGATMPSVLVEVAFVSNKQEAKRLKSRTYREHTADAIVTGVKSYLRSQKLLR